MSLPSSASASTCRGNNTNMVSCVHNVDASIVHNDIATQKHQLTKTEELQSLSVPECALANNTKDTLDHQCIRYGDDSKAMHECYLLSCCCTDQDNTNNIDTNNAKAKDNNSNNYHTGDSNQNQLHRQYYDDARLVDPNQDNRAVFIKLSSFQRPHMRAFHLAWFGFFVSFCLWFAIVPLLQEIRRTLHISQQVVWTSNIVGVSGTLLVRFMVGPFLDKYGPRCCMACILLAAAIPTAMTGLIESSNGLIVLRLFIGISGSAFVACQYWCSRMFAKQVVGTANAIAAGWGVAGGGVTQIMVGTLLFPLFKYLYRHNHHHNDDDDDTARTLAWRTVCVVPAFVAIMTAVLVYYCGDDTPKGNFRDLKREGTMTEQSAAQSFQSGIRNWNAWILFVQYGCCFGVELTMYNAAALYFHDKFGKSTESAAALASIFGWFNIFSRGCGGYISDLTMKSSSSLLLGGGMRGRLLIMTLLLLVEGVLVIAFANMESLGSSIAVMSLFAIAVQACNGSLYAIVPYVDPPNTGSVAGLVGAGGNAGAIAFGLIFKYVSSGGGYNKAFTIMGVAALCSSILSFFVMIQGHAGIILCKRYDHTKSKQELQNESHTCPPPPTGIVLDKSSSR